MHEEPQVIIEKPIKTAPAPWQPEEGRPPIERVALGTSVPMLFHTRSSSEDAHGPRQSIACEGVHSVASPVAGRRLAARELEALHGTAVL